MITINKKIILFLLVIFTGISSTLSQSFDVSAQLPIDEEFVIGKLPNGLTYYIREASNPKGRAEFFIVHNVGSLQEEDDQRGLAHFLEHMAFNGTKNFPDKALLNYFGSIGVKFGANINAYTSMDRTVYNISQVPVTSNTVIDSTLLALHDWSHYISCEAEEIEKERGVIREEWRRGDIALTRMMKAISRFQQTGSRFAERDVIGLVSVIDNFESQTLIDYYHKWYRPDLQAVIVVGDIDKKEMEQRIIKTFSSIPAVENAAVKQYYSIPDNKEPIIGYFTDPETSAVSARLSVKIPMLSDNEKQTERYFYEKLIEDIFIELMKNRFRVTSLSPEAPFRMVIPVFGSISYASRMFTATAIPVEDEKTFDALQGIVTEIERTRQYGFEQEELNHVKKIVAANLEKEYQKIKERKNVDYVNDAIENYTRNTPLVTLEQKNVSQKNILGKIALTDINSAINKFLSSENRVVVFATPEKIKQTLPTESQVLAMMEEVQNTEQEQFIIAEKKEIQFSDIKAPGRIIKSRNVTSKDYGIKYEMPLDSTTEWTLQNGVKVVWKEEFGKKENVSMFAFRKGGYAYPENIEDQKVLNSFLRDIAINNLNQHERAEWSLKNKLSLSPYITERNEGFSGSFDPESSEKFFNLLHKYFTDVSANQKEVENFKRRMLKSIENKNAQTFYKDSVNKLTYSNNPLRTDYKEPYVQSLTPSKLNALYQSHFYNPQGFTFIFSGPMRSKDAKPLIEKYMASISGKAKVPDLKFKEPVLRTGEVSLRYKAPDLLSSKASVTRIYHNKSDYTAMNNLLAKFTAYILSNRYLKSIREDKGGTYHVGVKSELSRYPTPTAIMEINFDTDPALVDDLLSVVQGDIQNLVTQGPTENEISEIKLYLEKRFQDRKENISWNGIISNALKEEPYLDLEELSLLDKINTHNVHQFAKSIFLANNKMTFVFEPQ